MAFLTVASVTVAVQARSATQERSERVGESTRAFDMTLRSTVRARKRGWKFVTQPLTAAEVTTLRSAIETGTGIVNCAGDALDGATVSCEVIIDNIEYIRDRAQATDFLRAVTLSLTEA